MTSHHTPRRNSGRFEGGIHHLDIPVYYEDTDAGGVVYYANYLRFAERGRTEALQLAGVNHIDLMRDHAVWFVARRCVVDYFKPGKLDDMLTVHTSIIEMKNTSLLMRQDISRSGERIARVDAFMVCVNSDVKPQRIPEPVREALLCHLPVQPHDHPENA